LEDFKQFLPESAAQAKVAAAKAAAEEASQNQTPQAIRETKMPPVGNFAVPASTSKPNNKRKNPPPVSTTLPPPENSNRSVIQGGNLNNKVSTNTPGKSIPTGRYMKNDIFT
jgi:paired amphipathic helix protein Sin3a